MKYLIPSLIGLVLAGCGTNYQKTTYYCGRQEGVLCDPNKDAEQDTRLSDLENQLRQLSLAFNSLVATVDALSVVVTTLDSNTYQAQIDSLNAQISGLQTQAGTLQSQVVTLSLQENVVEYINPCGDNDGFDEILLKTSSGKIIAYFQNGGDRFLSILTPGVYRTTDQSRCNFTITSDNQITNEYL